MADEVEEEEEFHTPRGRDLADEPEVEWMYADARVLPLPGLRAMAAANPLRWSRGRPDKIVDELESVGVGWWGGSNEARPVQLRIVGQSYMHKFASAREAAQVCRLVASRAPRLRRRCALAAVSPCREPCSPPQAPLRARGARLNLARTCQWLRGCEAEPDDESHRVTTIAAWLGKVMAAPALALFCRIHSQQPWARKNLFFASSYALRACNLPQKISRQQQFHSHAHHPRVQVVVRPLLRLVLPCPLGPWMEEGELSEGNGDGVFRRYRGPTGTTAAHAR